MAPEDGRRDEGRFDREGGDPKGASLGDPARVADSAVDLLSMAEGLRGGGGWGFREGEVWREGLEPTDGS